MKAVVSSDAPGAEDVSVAEVPDPVPGPGEVLIRVGYCGVNYPDVQLLQDKYQLRPPRPFTPGGEVGGEVTGAGPSWPAAGLGDGVTSFSPGDRVMARMSLGGMAELVAVPQDRVQKIPASMPLDEAAAIQTTYLTGYHALVQRAAMRAGERLLVLGFPSGIPRVAANLVLLKRCQVVGVLCGGWAATDPAIDRANCKEVLRMYEAGLPRPHVSARFPASQARAAIDELKHPARDRQGRGRVLSQVPIRPSRSAAGRFLARR